MRARGARGGMGAALVAVISAALLPRRLPAAQSGSFGQSQKALAHMRPLPSISLEDLSNPRSKYFSGSLPFVLKLNGSTGLGSAQKEWSVHWLAEHFGDEIVDWYPQGMIDIRSKPWLRPMRDVVADWARAGHPKWRDRRSTPYVQMRLQMASWRKLKKSLASLPKWFTVDEAWLQSCLPGRSGAEWPADNWLRHCHWKVLVLGKRGSGMFFHPDGISTSTYQMQIVGRKRWVVCHPSQATRLYQPGDVDVYNPGQWKRQHPLFAEAECTRTTVGPGEILYYPTGWWHQTDNLDSDTIGVAARRVDVHNYNAVYGQLVHKCEHPTEDISKKWPGAAPPLSATNCASIAGCHAMWTKEFADTPPGTCSAEKAAHGVCEGVVSE